MDGKILKNIESQFLKKKRILILVNTNLELNEIKISVAKIRNLENWKDHSGYKEVDNEGQNTASADG